MPIEVISFTSLQFSLRNVHQPASCLGSFCSGLTFHAWRHTVPYAVHAIW